MRSRRLLDLLQILRRNRHPVTGSVLAEELGISLRTLYRDIRTLQDQGARIDGASGLGYMLRSGFLLPPLMFPAEEVEALMLGTRWVAERGDAGLSKAARSALARITAVLPPEMRQDPETAGLLIGPGQPVAGRNLDLSAIRDAIRAEHRVTIQYSDENGESTARTVWPVARAFFDRARVIVAWCELRGAFRHFRADRIAELSVLTDCYPRRRIALLAEWRASYL